jgi:hypothetical protein
MVDPVPAPLEESPSPALLARPSPLVELSIIRLSRLLVVVTIVLVALVSLVRLDHDKHDTHGSISRSGRKMYRFESFLTYMDRYIAT